MQTVFLDAVLFLQVKQIQMSKFNTLLLQSLANFMLSVDKLIASDDMCACRNIFTKCLSLFSY